MAVMVVVMGWEGGDSGDGDGGDGILISSTWAFLYGT